MTAKVQSVDSFDGLLSRLVRVSKTELEAEERKYQAQRKRLREKGAGKTGKTKR